MNIPETLVLNARDVRELLPLDDCIAAVEAALLSHARGEGPPPAVLGVRCAEGGFHVKAAVLSPGLRFFAAKLNGNFPANPERFGLPTIQGVVALCDARDGRLLALMDSIEITRLRTGAASAVAARYLARPESAALTIYGCGRQGRVQVESLCRVLPIRRVWAFDVRPEASAQLCRELGDLGAVTAEPAGEGTIGARARESDVIVTCTSARRFILSREQVRPGTFIAAVGADDADKQELEPELMAASTVVADLLDQCAHIGDLHHAIAAGAMRRDDVHAELGEVLAGTRSGRSSADEITVFDSTGTALQDVAAAAVVYQRALLAGRGIPVAMGG